MPKLFTCLALASLMLVGCRSHASDDRTPRRPRNDSVQHEARTLDDYIARVQGARNAQQEADALRELHAYEVSNGMTYQLTALDSASGMRIRSPSSQTVPLRAQMTVFRGRNFVRTFVFVPHDNRNLAIFGE